MTDAEPHEPPTAFIADDLTGALDSAVAFAVRGRRVLVALNVDALSPDFDVVALNIDTRRLPAQDARPVIVDATASLARLGMRLRFVKIDSTLRGHPGAEIAVAASGTGARLVVVSPAFPAMGRTVEEGRLLVAGVPVEATEVGRDPLSPVGTSDVAAVLGTDMEHPTASIRLDTVRSPELEDLAGAELSLSSSPPRVVVCDAATDEDLDRLVTAYGALAEGDAAVLFAGSAGIASALARTLDQSAAQSRLRAIDGPLLFVTASQRSLTARQIDRLALERDVVVIPVEVSVVRGTIETVRFDRVRAAAALGTGDSVALCAMVQGVPLALSPAVLRDLADSIASQVAELVAEFVAGDRVGGIVTVGGDTAAAVLAAIEATGIEVTGEPLPGVPYGTLRGGELDGVPIATKAGAFGEDETLVQLHDYLRSEGARS